ncbi:hypothetical protein LCGC14_0297670 [marine sediment metagenome]|uniref:Uncharacterized protein n=1 Tax=marine sediment metagenome TaxID=412755 RepID=A0A0F9WX02_9ZZZZ
MRAGVSARASGPGTRYLVKAFRKQINLLSPGGRERYLAFLLTQFDDAAVPVQQVQPTLRSPEAVDGQGAAADTQFPLR